MLRTISVTVSDPATGAARTSVCPGTTLDLSVNFGISRPGARYMLTVPTTGYTLGMPYDTTW